jgi:hypothetical protein
MKLWVMTLTIDGLHHHVTLSQDDASLIVGTLQRFVCGTLTPAERLVVITPRRADGEPRSQLFIDAARLSAVEELKD